MQKYRKREYKGDNLRQSIKHTTLHYFKRMVFSGFVVTALLVIAQFLLLFAVFFLLDNYAKYYYEGSVLLAVICMIFIINDDSNPAYKMAWSLPIILFPVAGTLLFLYFKYNFGTLAIKKIASDIGRETHAYGITSKALREKIHKEDPELDRISVYLEKYGAATYHHSSMQYFPLGDDAMDPILDELEKAKKFIFMEFFMVEEGIFFDNVMAILEEKVKEGVEVRFMYDDIGCVALLPRDYAERLKAKGIKARTFAHIYPFFSTHYNNRDHRKIIVIDGKTAFTGGLNLCDEYINVYERFGHWKDNFVMVKGEAVKGFTLLFMQTWNSVAYKKGIDYSRYLCVNLQEDSAGEELNAQKDGYVIPYGDGPYQKENVAENVYLNILSRAKKYVYIMTPYLILDHEMEMAIIHAARSGVDVRLILPHVPDKKTPYYIARTYYRSLLEAGVKVYEYKPGFIHSKTFISDDVVATVGTINLDFRSLYLHYECGCLFYKNENLKDIYKDFTETFLKCILVDRDYYETIPLWQRIYGRIMRMFGPLM